MLRRKRPEDADGQPFLAELDAASAQPAEKGWKPFWRKHWKKILAVVCAAAVAGGILLPRFGAKPAQADTTYLEAAPETRNITNTFSGSGTLAAANTYTVKSLVKGTVLTADFEVGDVIDKGTVLYTIDSSDASSSIEKAQLSLDQAQRNYDAAVDAQYVRSMVGGTVASLKVAVGDVVNAGQEVAVVREDSTLLLTLEFPAADAAGFAVGQSAEVTLDGTFETLTGTVRSVAGTDALSSGNLLVRTVVIAVQNTGSLTTAQAATASINGVRALASARFAYQREQSEAMTLADGAVLLYNALTAATSEGSVYGTSLGFTVTDGQLDTASVLLRSLEGPFVAGSGESLPFVPATVYRNDSQTDSAQLDPYDVYYYNQSAKTVWIYSRRAAGRITAVSPSASAPTSVTVAGVSYTLASSAAASQLSSLNGGGVGQVVTLLLGMNNEAVAVLTGEQADEVFYGVVQSASRSLIEENGADVQQTVTVACTDGVTRAVNVDKSLNYPAGWLVEITVDENGENVTALCEKSVTGTFNAEGTALGEYPLADDVQILDTTTEGVAGTIRPSRLSGVTLSASDVKYYTTNAVGEIDRLILDDVTGDLWTYGVLDDVRNLVTNLTSSGSAGSTGSGSNASSGSSNSSGSSSTGSSGSTSAVGTIVSDVGGIVLPSTSEMLWGILDGSIGSAVWESVTSSTSSLASYLLKLGANNTTGLLSKTLNYFGTGANYVCYVNGTQTTYQTSVKYPVLAGGIAVGKTASGSVKTMRQLLPVVVDRLGAASVRSGTARYETADAMQVYLWYKGAYYATTLSQINTEEYNLIGWYDNNGSAAGQKIRVLIAVKKD